VTNGLTPGVQIIVFYFSKAVRFRRLFRQRGKDGCSMDFNVGTFLTKRAELFPQREAVVLDEQRLNYAELNERCNKLVHALRKMGVEKGDRVAILAFNEVEYLDLFNAAAKMGAIMVTLNYRLAGPELQYIMEDSGSKVLIFSKEFAEVVDSFRNDVPAEHYVVISDEPPEWAASYAETIKDEPADEPEIVGGGDDTLAILYTSGTTGRPKGAELTHNGFFVTSDTIIATVGMPGDTFLIVLPLFHIGALPGAILNTHFGLRVVLCRTLDPTRFLELLGEEKVTAFGSVPQLLQILQLVPDFEKYDWSSVQVILVYAAPVPVTLLNEYAAAGIEVRQLYGLTECTGPAAVIDGEHALTKAGSCGLPMFYIEIRLVDDDGNDVEVEELGEVIMRAQNVMKGYWGKPEETAKAIRDGWLYTGDIAKMDDEGYLYIMDRKKDMIISGGENIYPAEIEDYILSHPKIIDVGVIGCPDEKWGEAVRAVVVVAEGETLTEEEVIEYCKGNIGKFKIPKSVVFAPELPRTPTGKILKRVLRDDYNQ
jgi:fatty-acyl-CoA synthase